MFDGAAHPVLAGPQEAAAEFLGLFVGVGDQGADLVAEMLGAGGEADLAGGVDVDLFEFFGEADEGAEVHIGVLAGGGPDYAFGAAAAGEPDRGMGFLDGQHPGVDDAVVVETAFEAEGAGLGPAFDDQVVGFLEAVAVFGGVDAGLEGFDGAAADEAGNQASVGVAVQHRQFLGHADGVADGDDVAEDGDFGAAGEAADDGGVEVGGGFHIPVGGMVFVGHNAVEAGFVGLGILFVVLVI